MTSRERVLTALRHEEPDRVPIDLGGMLSTGIMAMAYNKLKAYLGIKGGRTRIYDYRQQLAEPEREILERVGADVVAVFVLEPKGWKKGKLPDGSSCEVPEWFNPERLPDGSQVLHDDEGHIIAKMPENGYYFDSMYHPLKDITSVQELERLDEKVLCSSMWSSFPPELDEVALNELGERAKNLYETTDYALMLNTGGIYEWAQDLRGWDNFMMDLVANQKLAETLLDRLLEIAIKRLKKILPKVEGYVQVIMTGDDLGTQKGPQLSPKLYRKIVKPRHRRLYQYIKEHTSAYLFLHTCGSVYEFIPDFIEMGVDIINPVQVSAKDMDTGRLKREFGKDITFWGGGCDTQRILPFGKPDEVAQEVKRRIEDLAPGGGFVFSQVHDIQAGTPPENIMTMYEAAKRYGRYKKS